MILEITNLARGKVSEKFLREAAAIAQKILGRRNEKISLVLATSKEIREINKKYRGQDRVTDVLSFEELNEIFISLPQAKKQSLERKISLNCELTRLLVHGIVHLAGFDHEKSAKKAERMFAVEEKILRSLK